MKPNLHIRLLSNFLSNENAQKEDNYEVRVTHIYSMMDTAELETGLFADITFPFKE